MEHLFTFIANYKGGVFIRQITAEDLPSACHIWGETVISASDFPELNVVKFRRSFKEEMDDFPPSLVQDTANVWCFTVGEGRSFMLVNVVKTENVFELA